MLSWTIATVGPTHEFLMKSQLNTVLIHISPKFKKEIITNILYLDCLLITVFGYLVTRFRWKATEQRTVIAFAMSAYHDNTCIRFVPRTCERNYLTILKTGGGYVTFSIAIDQSVSFSCLHNVTNIFFFGTIKLLGHAWHGKHWSSKSKSRWWLHRKLGTRSSYTRTNARRWILPWTHTPRSWQLRDDQF
jgi:hypothetical protein